MHSGAILNEPRLELPNWGKKSKNVDMASQYTTNLKEQMDPLAKDLMTKITKGVDMLRERIEKLVSTVRCALKPYTEYVTSPFEKDVDYIRESLDFEDLKATVLQRSEELRDSLEQGVKELQAGALYLRETLDP
ncbi:hypothetical protein cypCar_00041878 [Cyprinus carpio]|nr:hypothetical protein cypCar_00041878 [Cyprinus carpio]